MSKKPGGTRAVSEYALEVGRRIALARNELGMEQVELAELIHVHQRTMQAYENGEIVPYRKMDELEFALNKSKTWILHGTEDGFDGASASRLLQEVVATNKAILKELHKMRGSEPPSPEG